MPYQWLEMRISEEQDRRKKEAVTLERLPRALHEVHEALNACVETYTSSFGPESAQIVLDPARIRITIHEETEGVWQQISEVEISIRTAIPGFQVERAGAEPFVVEV